MSARLLRRVLEEQELQQRRSSFIPEHDAEEDESEDTVSVAPSRNPFDLLDDQDNELETEKIENVEIKEVYVEKESSGVPYSHNQKSKKKKSKKKNKGDPINGNKDDIDLILEDLSITPRKLECKSADIDSKSNSAGSHFKTVVESSSYILTVDPKHLKAENELRKIFGSKVVNAAENRQNVGGSRQMLGGRRSTYNLRKTILINPSSHWPRWDGSLSMELIETKGGVHYFRYVHSPSYQYVQEAFEAAKAIHDLNAIGSILAQQPFHIEALLTFAEVFKFSGEHQSSADAIGKCLFALECAWHPLFSPAEGKCRLKYTHDTNKPLFSALFTHMKNMDRRGCHRSALEVCKLLLSLDSDDPTGALFCIDYFSLRAQEFVWLEKFSEEYISDNSLWLFPNFSYSLAVSRYYLEQDSSHRETDIQIEKATSSDLMKQALLLHPFVLKKLVDKAPLKDVVWKQILENSFFGSAQAGSSSLEHLANIYVEREYLIWRFPELQNLLSQGALSVIDSLGNNKAEAKDWACIRKEAFPSEKNEYSHLLVSDFSDAVQSIPPEELRQFMVGPHVLPNMQDANVEGNPERVRVQREVAGRNTAVVFLESLLPWIDYGNNENRQRHGDNQEFQE